MSTNKPNIEEILTKLIYLLESYDTVGWEMIFKKLLAEYRDIRKRDEAVESIINTYKGGMGSFDDLIFQKDNKMLMEENNELDKLKDELYNVCKLYKHQQGITD